MSLPFTKTLPIRRDVAFYLRIIESRKVLLNMFQRLFKRRFLIILQVFLWKSFYSESGLMGSLKMLSFGYCDQIDPDYPSPNNQQVGTL